MTALTLNAEQRRAYDAALAGYNLFVTGGAGTGKSVLVRAIKQRLGSSCLVAAPTGLAALNVDGVTIHSLFKNGAAALKEIRTLILDEASMIPPDMVSRLVGTAKRVRECDAPWGGLQVIVVGDLAQIPPVIRDGHKHTIDTKYGGLPFFFASRVFGSFRLVELAQIMRQSDPILCEALKELRFGRLTPNAQAVFDHCVASRPDGVLAIVVTNKRASEINAHELAKLDSDVMHYPAAIDGEVDERALPADATLALKAGARVVFLKNGDGYVNGDTGAVTALDECGATVRLDRGPEIDVGRSDWTIKEPRVQTYVDDDGHEQTIVVEVPVGTFSQLPLRLGWALSIHKAQGMSLDRAHVDLGGGTFCHGQAYVALSRCRSLNGLTLERPLRPSDFIFDQRAFGYTSIFASLGRIEDQARGCSAYNRTGRPFRGDERLSACPLSRAGCPRLAAVTAGDQHAQPDASLIPAWIRNHAPDDGIAKPQQ